MDSHQDSLHITQDYGSTVVLANNHIRVNQCRNIGKSPRSGSYLIIQDNNEFMNADLDIQNNSKLFLDNAKIQNLNYQLGDNVETDNNREGKKLIEQYKTWTEMKLTIKSLSKTYSNGVNALKDVSLVLENGMFGLLGPNGAGKSSLMRTIATLQEADRGHCIFR